MTKATRRGSHRSVRRFLFICCRPTVSICCRRSFLNLDELADELQSALLNRSREKGRRAAPLCPSHGRSHRMSCLSCCCCCSSRTLACLTLVPLVPPLASREAQVHSSGLRNVWAHTFLEPESRWAVEPVGVSSMVSRAVCVPGELVVSQRAPSGSLCVSVKSSMCLVSCM